MDLKLRKTLNRHTGKEHNLADTWQKADQYTDTQGTRTNEGLTMFLVRLALGWTVQQEFSHLDCDTVVGGRGNLFQEFVYKKDENLFPELLIDCDLADSRNILVHETPGHEGDARVLNSCLKTR